MNQPYRQYTWVELQDEYPNQWCGLIDVVKGDNRSVPFQTATLICHGDNRQEVGDQFEDVDGTGRMMIFTNLNQAYMLGGGVLI